MVGVRVSVEDPLDLQPVLPDEVEQGVGIFRGSAAGLLVEIEDRIDDCASSRLRVGNDILDGPARLVVKACHLQLGR
jgi:hypothetical protein